MTKQELEAEKQRLDEERQAIQVKRKALRDLLEPIYAQENQPVGGTTTLLKVGGK